MDIEGKDQKEKEAANKYLQGEKSIGRTKGYWKYAVSEGKRAWETPRGMFSERKHHPSPKRCEQPQ